MKRELEALLFATDSPLTLNRLKKLFPGVETAERKKADSSSARSGADRRVISVLSSGGG